MLSARSSQSSRGPDTIRTNIVEGFLNHWQADPAMRFVRRQLRRAWYIARLALEMTSEHPRIVKDVARKICGATGDIMDIAGLDSYEFCVVVGTIVACRFESCARSTATGLHIFKLHIACSFSAGLFFSVRPELALLPRPRRLGSSYILMIG